MRKEMLNVAWLNGAMPMGNGGASGGGGVTINNQDKTVDITDNGTTKVTADSGYTGLGTVTVNTNVKAGGGDTPSRPTYTGHADVEGLKAIGWTDEDIAYYQANGVNWNEEDDEYHKVPEDNIALYGVLTANNISSYQDRIVYLPKIDTSSVTSMSYKFYSCHSLVAIPQLDTRNVTSMYNMFYNCFSLLSIPQLNTSNVTDMSSMFYNCYALVSIPQLDTRNVTNMEKMFETCYSLVSIPQLDTSSVTNMNNMFYNCYALVSIPQLDTSSVTKMERMFNDCHSLVSIPQLDTSKVSSMSYMSINCYSLVSIPQLDTSSVTNMEKMFYNCYSLVAIPQLDTSKVTNMSDTFYGCRTVQIFNLKGLRRTLVVSNSHLLTKDSLLYIINNESATSAITIQLSSYCYTKYAEDADVVAALSNHPNISLAK